MDHRDVLTDAAHRPVDAARVVLDGLTPDQLVEQPAPGANSIGWLVWHAARQMDVQLAALTGKPTVWATQGWAGRLGIARDDDDFGLGDGPDEVASLRPASAAALLEHLAACTDALVAHVATLSATDLDEVVDTSWTPHVTRGVRLVSIIDDAAVHLGQAAYVRGLLQDWSVGV